MGRFENACDFDPGPGEDIHETNDNEQNYGDAFLSKFDTDGNYQWARTWGGTHTDLATSIILGADGSIYMVGFYMYTVDFDPGPGVDEHTAIYSMDNYFCRYNGSGEFLWAGTWAGDSDPNPYNNLTLASDDVGGIYVTGKYSLPTDFDPGPGVEERTPPFGHFSDMFLSKFNTDCEFQWVLVWGGDGTYDLDDSYSVACGPDGEPYVTGMFDGTCDFDPGPGVDERSTTPFVTVVEGFLLKLAPDGSY